jgi:penicillin-binding protein 2
MNDSQPLRISILAIVALALFTALFSRLWFLQVMAAPEYSAQAETNRTRTIVVEGPRGRILDRHGNVLADNRESMEVIVDLDSLNRAERDEPGSRLATFELLASELERTGTPTTVEQIEQRIDRWRGDPHQPVVVAEDVHADLWITINERAPAFPGIAVRPSWRRDYPYGTLAAHVIGYVGEVNETELMQVRDSPKPYRGGDSIGKAGVEQMFEQFLRGTPGRIVFEVDSVGRVVGILHRDDPEPGADLRLALDIDLQGITERALEEELARARTQQQGRRPAPPAPAGSAVVLDPSNGELLAMASFPTFDPNELTAGVTQARYEELSSREHYSPLTNRAIRNPYQVGSTFKLFSGYAAAAEGLRSPNYAINDPGYHTLRDCVDRCTFWNANNQAHGMVDLPRALEVSSNTYFYQVGEDFWRQRNVYGERPIQDFAEQLGVGQPTGIQLPLDEGGILMDPALKQQRNEANPVAFPYGTWFPGDNVNLAIGQADVGITPLQLANAYGTFGNGGTLHQPNVVLDIVDPLTGEVLQSNAPRVANRVEFDPGLRGVITDGLVRVTQGQDGTATAVFDGFPHQGFAVAGKTGTAQVGGGRRDSSLFAAWAPADNPRYAISVVGEESGFGSRVAAPVARRILDPLAQRDLYGVPLTPAPLRGQTVEEDVPEFQLGDAFD